MTQTDNIKQRSMTKLMIPTFQLPATHLSAVVCPLLQCIISIFKKKNVTLMHVHII